MSYMQTGIEYSGEAFILDESRSAFPIPTPESVVQMQTDGYGKLGYAFAIEDPLGRVYVYPHKAKENDGVTDGQWSIPSETTKGRFDDEGRLVQVETLEECLARCLDEEQVIDLSGAPEDATLSIVRAEPLSIIDWSMSHDSDADAEQIKDTFAIALSLRANIPMATFMSMTRQETDEGYGGFFQTIDFLQDCVQKRRIRAAFDAWLTQHTMPDVQPAGEESAITIPEIISGQDWKSLRFKKLGTIAIGNDAA